MLDKEALVVTVGILDGLELLHELGYAHRDIKRENIMFQRDGTVMVGNKNGMAAYSRRSHFRS